MIGRFAAYFKQYKKYAVLGCLCVIVETMFELIIPLLMADIIDVGVATGDKAYIIRKGIEMIICAFMSLALGIAYAKFAALSGQGLGAEIRKAEYKKIQSFSFANADHFSTSSLVTRLTSDVQMIQNSISTGIRPIVRAPVMMITALILAFSLNARLAFVFLVAAPLLGISLFFIVSHVRPLYSKMQKAIDMVNRIVQENLIAIRVVKAYARKEYEIEKFTKVNDDLKFVSEQAFKTASLNMPVMQFVMYGTILAILWFGGNLIFIGNMQVGELTGFLSYVLQILNSLMMISSVFMMLTRAMASGNRIIEVLDEEIDIKEDKAGDVTIEKGSIDFEHVYFKYKQSAKEYVLSDISIHINSGETIGIIGGTGSAKSTLVQLIPRLYDVSEGSVKVDGRLVNAYSLSHLRDAIAVVLQKNTLFSGTIRENLKWGKEDASEAELNAACKVACAAEFIEKLKDGLDTYLEQGGVNLSGGQKQRLCIARAILKQPKVLILDDSTSAVDTMSEKKIREGFAKEMPHTTKLIIAQRISSVLHADQIIILDDGKINGMGTHESLLKNNAIYQEIYAVQEGGSK